MSASQGCIDDKAVIEVEKAFREALKGRTGEDRYRMWFSQGVEFEFDTEVVAAADASDARPVVGVRLNVRGQFALDRIRQHFLQSLRGAALEVFGQPIDVELRLIQRATEQSELPLGLDATAAAESVADKASRPRQSTQRSAHRSSQRRRRSGPTQLSKLVGQQKQPAPAVAPAQPKLPQLSDDVDSPTTDANEPAANDSRPAASAASLLISGACNELAHMAMSIVCKEPHKASPLFLCGPTGTGKSHMLTAIAEQFRRRHRMRRVMQLSAEQFTNDFITSVGNSGITAFRQRYRDVDALLVDDVQFLGAKKATLREMLYTVETLLSARRPLVFSGLTAPTEIRGLSRELSGRMAAGYVCSIQPLDSQTREELLRRWIEERCPEMPPDAMIEQMNATLAGDGRVLSGVVNVLNTLQRMTGRNPSMDELRRHAGQLLRSAPPVANLNVIEAAVCEAFQLEPQTLRGGSQIRAVTEPRMLAMYLSRQLTSSAYSEIARHFGGKSHSTAISAEKNIKTWLQSGKPIGRGPSAMSVREAIDRVEGLMRTG